ncbi:MAG: hypothetical protein PHP82_04545, partial [Candidatus ainarchaeum sp.]|nr:hypothetical protein [Candidatus ainarchaeum sp.]
MDKEFVNKNFDDGLIREYDNNEKNSFLEKDEQVVGKNNKLKYFVIGIIIFLIIIGIIFFVFKPIFDEQNYSLEEIIQDDFPDDQNYLIDDSFEEIVEFEDSPFGIFAAFSSNEFVYFNQRMGFNTTQYFDWAEKHMENLGAHWTRSNVQLIWDLIEPEIGKGYNWDNTMLTDSIIKRIYDSKLEINWLGVFSEGGGVESVQNKPKLRNPIDYPEEYSRFVASVVERYNGDGINDASSNVRVKYWQVGNEILGWTNSNRDVDDYIEWLKIINSVLKKIDPEAKIVLIAPTDSMNISPFIRSVIEKTSGENLFDVIDLHHWGNYSLWNMRAVPEYKRLLVENGYDNIEIWSCEHGTWQGSPKDVLGIESKNQTELQQAQFLVKTHVFNIKQGVSKIMWNNLVEWNNFSGVSDSIFNSMGLISDGQGPGEDEDMFNKPRLSYFSYKLMVEMLGGFDWGNIETIVESGGVYVYKFVRVGVPVWVVWWDYWGESDLNFKTVSFDVGGIDFVKIVEAIPKYDSGIDVVGYESAFNYGVVNVDGNLVVEVGGVPVYVQESFESLKQYVSTRIEDNVSDNNVGPDCVGLCVDEGNDIPYCVKKCFCGDGVC